MPEKSFTAIDFATRLLGQDLSPQAFAPPGTDIGNRATSTWHGAAESLRKLGLRPGAEVRARDLAAVVSGRHARTGAQVLPAGEAFEVVFKAPNSVSCVWSQLGFARRVEIEDAMLDSVAFALDRLVLDNPVVGGVRPARSCVAAMVLHAVGTRSSGNGAIPPVLHVHCCLLTVVDHNGAFVWPYEEALYDEETIGMCDLLAETRLANRLVELGYSVRNPPKGSEHSFDIDGVPQALLDDADFWRNVGCAVVQGE